MTTFSSMDIGRTGVGFAHHWLEAVAHNLTNVSTDTPGDGEPFRARMLVARPNADDRLAPTGSGVHVAEVRSAEGDPPRRYEPGHPLADADGYVTGPVVDLAGQMTDLVLAQRTYQANLQTIQTAREAYTAALRLGQG